MPLYISTFFAKNGTFFSQKSSGFSKIHQRWKFSGKSFIFSVPFSSLKVLIPDWNHKNALATDAKKGKEVKEERVEGKVEEIREVK